jgi:carbamoyl-phosphate synthase large subunit
MIKNVLILSVGRRVELVKLFKKAKKRLGIDGLIIGADMDENAPALQFVDKIKILPRISSESYLSELIDTIKEEKVDLVIPTIDTELLKLAENKIRIEKETGAIINLSSLEVIEICRNKFSTQKFFEENGFGVPKLITDENLLNQEYTFPLFIKPLNGSSSINAFKVNNEKELKFFKEYVPSPIIQECVVGDEFTIDVFCDFDSNPITIVPRKRLATRSGEISKGLIIKDREIIQDVKKVVEVLKPIGHITIQCIKTDRGIKYLEINPRFGGGAPMSIVAGADSPENLYRLISGEKLIYTEKYQDNFLALRYDEAVFISSDRKVIKNV